MREFIRSSLLRDHTTATEVDHIDLPINPVSHLIFTIDGYNVTDEATLAEILAFINNINVAKSGNTILDLQSEDLYALNCFLFKRRPVLEGKVATDNHRRVLSLIVPFGRRIMDPNECLPASKKGEYKLTWNTTVPATSLDNSTLNIEAVEMPGATPQRFLKSTLKIITAPGATGNNDVDLPIGNKIVGLLIRMTTFEQASSHSYGVDAVKIMRNNNEFGYAFARTQCLVGDMINRLDGQHGAIAAQGAIQPANTIFIDYDPNSDDEWLLETAGASRVHAVLEMGVDEATYMTVLELVDVAGQAAPLPQY